MRYGIIGCGMMGHEHIKNILLLDHTAIVAGVEPDAGMRATTLSLVPDMQFEPSIEALLQRSDIDCLVIASPNFRHGEQLKQIAQTNPLPLLIEKPLITDSANTGMIEALIESYPSPVWVAMEYRYMPPVAALIEQVPEATGEVKMLTIREHRFPFLEKVGDWNRFNDQSGGTLVEKCCHFFDLMRLIMQSEPTCVMASAGQSINHLDESYDGRIPDIWDNGYVIVDFASGSRAMLELCMFAEGAEFQEEISVVGAKGKVECFVPGPGRFWPPHLGDPPTPKLVVSPREPKGPVTSQIPVDDRLLAVGDHNGSTFYQHQKFQSAVLNKTRVEVTLRDGLKAVQMGIAAQDSATSKHSIQFKD